MTEGGRAMQEPIPDELIEKLCKLSDRQLDETLKPRLLALKGRKDDEVKSEVLSIIADCINYALCSGFVLTVLQEGVYVRMCGGQLGECVGKIHSYIIEE